MAGGINIPSRVFSGFEILTSLSQDQVQSICTYLDDMIKDPRMYKFTEFLDSIGISKPDELTTTILSFSSLLKDKSFNNDTLSKELTKSYIRLSNSSLSDEESQRLSSNLYQIF